MSRKIKLKNAKDHVIVDDNVYEHLVEDPYLKKVDFVNNLRKHTSGCVVFQKSWKNAEGYYRIETIYLHRYLAEKYIPQPDEVRKLVSAVNGNKLDCRLENLVWRSRSQSSRMRKTSNKTGYTGVYQERKKFRSIIYLDGKAKHIGMFDTAEDAARAYNAKAKEHYGDAARLNIIKGE